jgi:hypothetical protein
MAILLSPVRPDRFPRDLQPPAESRASLRTAWFHGTPIARKNRNQRSKSMPYERIVSSDRPAACKWPK